MEEMAFQVTHKIDHFDSLFTDERVYALFEEDDLVKLLADGCQLPHNRLPVYGLDRTRKVILRVIVALPTHL